MKFNFNVSMGIINGEIQHFYLKLLNHCYGCTDSTAHSFNPMAQIDDCSCVYCDLSNSTITISPTSLSSCNGVLISNSNASEPINRSWISYDGIFISNSNIIDNLCNDVYILNLSTPTAGCIIVDTFFLVQF